MGNRQVSPQERHEEDAHLEAVAGLLVDNSGGRVHLAIKHSEDRKHVSEALEESQSQSHLLGL